MKRSSMLSVTASRLAAAGNGEFIYVNSERELRKYMKEQYEVIKQQWLEWKEKGKKDAIEQKEDLKSLYSQ